MPVTRFSQHAIERDTPESDSDARTSNNNEGGNPVSDPVPVESNLNTEGRFSRRLRAARKRRETASTTSSSSYPQPKRQRRTLAAGREQQRCLASSTRTVADISRCPFAAAEEPPAPSREAMSPDGSRPATPGISISRVHGDTLITTAYEQSPEGVWKTQLPHSHATYTSSMNRAELNLFLEQKAVEDVLGLYQSPSATASPCTVRNSSEQSASSSERLPSAGYFSVYRSPTGNNNICQGRPEEAGDEAGAGENLIGSPERTGGEAVTRSRDENALQHVAELLMASDRRNQKNRLQALQGTPPGAPSSFEEAIRARSRVGHLRGLASPSSPRRRGVAPRRGPIQVTSQPAQSTQSRFTPNPLARPHGSGNYFRRGVRAPYRPSPLSRQISNGSASEGDAPAPPPSHRQNAPLTPQRDVAEGDAPAPPSYAQRNPPTPQRDDGLSFQSDVHMSYDEQNLFIPQRDAGNLSQSHVHIPYTQNLFGRQHEARSFLQHDASTQNPLIRQHNASSFSPSVVEPAYAQDEAAFHREYPDPTRAMESARTNDMAAYYNYQIATTFVPFRDAQEEAYFRRQYPLSMGGIDIARREVASWTGGQRAQVAAWSHGHHAQVASWQAEQVIGRARQEYSGHVQEVFGAAQQEGSGVNAAHMTLPVMEMSGPAQQEGDGADAARMTFPVMEMSGPAQQEGDGVNAAHMTLPVMEVSGLAQQEGDGADEDVTLASMEVSGPGGNGANAAHLPLPVMEPRVPMDVPISLSGLSLDPGRTSVMWLGEVEWTQPPQDINGEGA
ncbi:hypothetical protein ACQKWADRAFT_325666 [Trichoderma austrokoningii]